MLFSKKMLILLFLLVNLVYSLTESQQISQCGNGKATYYQASSTGNCNFGDITGTVDTAAAEMEIYDGSNGCGICYEVIGELGSKIVMIADSCPTCTSVKQTGKIHLDLDERVFASIDEKSKGIINTSIRMVPCQVSGNIKLKIMESNNYYFNALVYNYKIGLKSLQISINNGNYVTVERKTHNRFESQLSGLNSITVKVTSISGEEIICYQKSSIIQGDYECNGQFSVKNFYDLYSRKIINSYKKIECCVKPSLISDITSCNVDTNYDGSKSDTPGSDSNSSKRNKLSIIFTLLSLVNLL